MYTKYIEIVEYITLSDAEFSKFPILKLNQRVHDELYTHENLVKLMDHRSNREHTPEE